MPADTIEGGWEEFKKMVLVNGTPCEIESARRIFYAGAMVTAFQFKDDLMAGDGISVVDTAARLLDEVADYQKQCIAQARGVH
ncbi:MAG TPA: hypothetical protein VGN16_09290 [Acidobacteriaceae bacterium]|jgi:enoyl-CoA hydratase/carnithine racemase